MRLRLRLGIVVIVVTLLAGCLSPGGERLVPANMPELKEALGVVQDPLAPLAKAVTNASVVGVGSPVRFSAEGTSDPQGLPLAYLWAFGDGATGEGAQATHAYEAPGEYAARLTVTNAGGAADHAVVTVQVLARDLATRHRRGLRRDRRSRAARRSARAGLPACRSRPGTRANL